MIKLEEAEARSKELGPKALYFGCWDRHKSGHYLHDEDGITVHTDLRKRIEIHWDTNLMDGGLLDNGRRKDTYDGKVFHTCGGTVLWHAFYWWDRSGDRRPASNSGFYVRGFAAVDRLTAFQYACQIFPHIVKRQKFPLILQD